MTTYTPGVLRGDEYAQLIADLKAQGRALPAVNVVGSSSVNAALEAAKIANSPIIIQFSHGGAAFCGGKGIDKMDAAIGGAIAGAHHVHTMAQHYGVSVVLHTDHADKSLLPWIDALLDAGASYKEIHGRPLYSSHMLDLSVEPLDDIISISADYLQRLSDLGMMLETEIGITGGEEDGVDNSDVDNALLYTQPEHVSRAYDALTAVSPHFLIAAAFGNVHGVYKPGNVILKPDILADSQRYIEQKNNITPNPVSFVFHGGSGSDPADIRKAIDYGVVKMNIDTDTQRAFWDGVRAYEAQHHDRLQAQIGTATDPDLPNKKIYDPRQRLRAGEQSMTQRLLQAYRDLGTEV